MRIQGTINSCLCHVNTKRREPFRKSNTYVNLSVCKIVPHHSLDQLSKFYLWVPV